MRAAAVSAACALALAGCARPAPRESTQARIAAAAERRPDVEAGTRALAALGPRVTGSAACARAEEWAAGQLRDAGLAPVLETYPAPPGAAGPSPRNVLADLPGRERGLGLVALVAHLDSVAEGEGAEDAAVNAAGLVAAIRAVRDAAPRPRRTIRLVLVTGEEQGMAGSAAYVAAHGSEPHALAVVFDLGSGRTAGFYLNGRKEPLRALYRRALAPDPRWRALYGTYEIWAGCDAWPFVRAGIPVLTALQDASAYRAVHHTAADRIDRVDFAEARRNAGLAAALAWGAADDAAGDLPRMTAAETAALLERHGLSGTSPVPSPR